MNTMRRLGTTLVVGLVVAALATAATAGSGAQKGTIVDVAAGNKSFTTLVTLVKAGGLAKALSGNTKLTVLAPTNAAFAALEKEVPGVTAALTDPANKALLAQVLKYHVVAGDVRSPAVIAVAKKKGSVPTLLGKTANGKVKLALKGG